MTVRPFRVTDLEAVVALERQAFPSEPYSPPVFVQLSELFPTTFFVADDARGRVLGYAIVGRRGDQPASGVLLSMAVSTDCQRAGLGTQLLVAAMEVASEERVATLDLTVSQKNVSAVAFYTSLGFRVVGDVPDMFGPDRSRLRMRRSIEGFGRAALGA